MIHHEGREGHEVRKRDVSTIVFSVSSLKTLEQNSSLNTRNPRML
jgi:hypothetical protein